ncbi:MAG TPA: hypothetical protein PKA88_00165 [Polyangiaceae bacterium]|nr:hypothetical protein [Polyangiaceae bacterium]HMR74140.1 hypothetical protein [Polyangiaceae bacterium]
MRKAGVLLALLAFGCSSTTSNLRTRFSKESGCPEAQVGVSERGGNVYRATGCGKTKEYVCGGFASATSVPECQERGLPSQAPASGDPRRFPEPVNPGQRPGPDQK